MKHLFENMTYKAKLENELELMREVYPPAKELEDIDILKRLVERADEIKILLNNLCVQCKEEPRKYNEFYCSKICNDKYYPLQREKGQQKDVAYMQKRLLEMATKEKEKRFKTQQKLV